MEIQLLQGEFNPGEALELITNMIQVKIKYHEGKIAADSSEEDIKLREAKIKRAQKDLFDLRRGVNTGTRSSLKLMSIIKIEE